MATRLTFSFYGDKQIDRTLENISDRAENATPVWEHLADRFLDAERRQFQSEGGFGSGRWKPLSPNYAAWKARHWPGRGILVRTEELMRSLTTGPQVRVITPSQMMVGSAVKHGEYHQRGEGVPRRRPVELHAVERREWVKAVHRFLRTGEAWTYTSKRVD